MTHWHRRDKGTKTDDQIVMYGCTEPGCAWAVFVHPNGREEWVVPDEKPAETARRLAHEAQTRR